MRQAIIPSALILCLGAVLAFSQGYKPIGLKGDGDGSQLTNLDAANITAGSVASAFDGGAITNLTTTESDTLATVAARGSTYTGGVTLATTAGNVGIGTNTPGANLHVAKAQNASTGITLQNAFDAAGATAELTILQGLGIEKAFYVGAYPTNDATAWRQGKGCIFTDGDSVGVSIAGRGSTDSPIAFLTGGTSPTERMRITHGGNVGIGTNNPATVLDVNGAATIRSNLNMVGSSITNGSFVGNGSGLTNLTSMALTTNLLVFSGSRTQAFEIAASRSIRNIHQVYVYAGTNTVPFDDTATFYQYRNSNNKRIDAKYALELAVVTVASSSGASITVADGTVFATNDLVRILGAGITTTNHQYVIEAIAGNVLTVDRTIDATYTNGHWASQVGSFGGGSWYDDQGSNVMRGKITFATLTTNNIRVEAELY